MSTVFVKKRAIVLAIVCLLLIFTAFSVLLTDLNTAVAETNTTNSTNDAMTAAKAELAEQHGSHDDWTAISAPCKISASGSYYLTQDINGQLEFAHPGTYTLCLNGYMINANGSGSAIWFSGNTYGDYEEVSFLQVYDCNGSHSTHNYNVGSDGKYDFTSSGTAGSVDGGVITGGNSADGGGINANGYISVSLNGVTVAGNRASGSGGGISVRHSGSCLNVNNCVIEGNLAANGGGIYSETFNFHIENTVLSYNKASSAGGALYSGEQYNSDHFNAFNITDSKFLNNTAVNGGGVAFGNTSGYSSNPDVVTGVEFSGNTASGNGGGIYCVSKSEIQFSGIEFYNNTAKNGGAVYSGGANELSFSSGDIFSANTATASVGTTTYESLAGGGAIYASGGRITLPSGVTVHNNKADNAYGGGILATGSASISVSAIVSGNSAKYGGGVYVRFSASSPGSFSVSGEISVYDNSGGNVYLYSGSSNYIRFAGSLNTDSRIGVIIEGEKGVFATGYDKAVHGYVPASKYFYSDEGYEVYEENGKLRFQQHYVDGNEYQILPPSYDLDQGTSGSPVYYFMQKDIGRAISVSGHLVLDLNGYTLNGNLTVSGSLVVIDSSSERSGKIDAGSDTAVTVQSGSFTLKGGTLSGINAISVSGGSATVEDGYIGASMIGNVTVKGGLFAQGDIEGNSVYGINLTSEYNIKELSSTNDDPRYKDEYPYAVYFGEDDHSSYGTVLSGATTLTGGYYYLTQDITLSPDEFIFVMGDVTICLHGRTISKNRPDNGFPNPNWEQSADSVAIKVISGGNLTIVDCDGGGYLPTGVDFDYNTSSLTIRGGHIGGYYMLFNLWYYITIEGGYYTSQMIFDADDDYVCIMNYKSDPDCNLQYPYAVYKKGHTSLSVTADSRPYNGQPLALGNEIYATAYAGYGEPQVNWLYYLDSGYTQPVYLGNMVNAGTYYIKASIPAYLDINGNEKTYYKEENVYSSITITQLDPQINAVTDMSVPLFTTSDFPPIFTSEGDTPGTITWDEGQTLQAGTHAYSWTFVPDDPNYKTVKDSIELTVEKNILVSIEVTQSPTKTEYTAFEIFDPSGMAVVAYFSDGSIADVTDAVLIGKGTDIALTCGEDGVFSITVYYLGGEDMTEATAEIKVYVNKIVVSAPEAATGLVYNGAEQEGVADGELYSVTNGIATNAGDYVAELALDDAENYTWEDGFDGKVKWSIAKAPSVGYIVPTGIEAVYGSMLADVNLPVGWSWQNNSQLVGAVGQKTFIAVFTPEDTVNYETVTKSLIITVEKATPVYTVPSGLTAVYGSMLADVNLPVGWSWQNNSQLVGAVGQKTFIAVFTPEDTVNYVTVNKSLTLTVEKATPVYTVPSGLAAVYGDTLADVNLPAGWSWQEDSQLVGAVGQKVFIAVFTPEDTVNYVTVNKSLTLTVEKATPVYTVPSGLAAVYGDTLADVKLPAGWSWQDNSQSVGNAGNNSFVAIYTPDDTQNYETVNETIGIKVEKAKPEFTLPDVITITEGQTLSQTVLPEGWTWKDGEVTVNGNGEATYTIVFTPTDSDNYDTVEVTVTVKIVPAGLSGGEIAGIAIGSAAGAGGIGLLIWYLLRKKKRTT